MNKEFLDFLYSQKAAIEKELEMLQNDYDIEAKRSTLLSMLLERKNLELGRINLIISKYISL